MRRRPLFPNWRQVFGSLSLPLPTSVPHSPGVRAPAETTDVNDRLSDDPQSPERKRWSANAKICVAVTLFTLYVLSIGPAYLIAAKTGHYGFLVVYRPLLHAAEPLGNVSRALSAYIDLFVSPRCF
jgi:hypothetical protein